MSVAAVILAAGGGSRFNRGDLAARPGEKLLRVVEGRALVTWALAPAIDARLDEVVVVAGAADLKAILPSRSRCCRTMSGRGARRRRFGWVSRGALHGVTRARSSVSATCRD